MGVLLGAIADDFTGATDLCNTLVRRGMRTVQLIGVPAERAPPAGRRGGRRRAEKPDNPGRGGRRDKPRRARLAAPRRGAADPFQILLDLRFDRPGQYRPGRRGAARRLGFRLHLVLPRFSRERPDDLQRLSVRRRRAAVGIRHARPSADADARPLPRARPAAPDDGAGRAGAARHGRARAGRDPRCLRRAARRGYPARDRRCDRRRAISRQSARRRPICR